MGVLEEEMKIMDKIVELKKKKKADFDCWELKKGNIELIKWLDVNCTSLWSHRIIMRNSV